MKLITFTILLICTSAYITKNVSESMNSKYLVGVQVNIDDLRITNEGIHSFTAKGIITYSNWPRCEEEVKQYNLARVCMFSRSKLSEYDFTHHHSIASYVRCSGQDFDMGGYYEYTPAYFGCGVTNREFAFYTSIDLSTYTYPPPKPTNDPSSNKGLPPLSIFMIIFSVIAIIVITTAAIIHINRKIKESKKSKSLLEDKLNDL